MPEDIMPEMNNPRFWLNKGAAFSNQGKYSDALGCFDRCLSIDPAFAIAWNHKGFVLRGIGNHREALQAFRNFVQSAGPDQATRIDKAREIIRELESKGRPAGDKEIWKIGDRIEGRYEIREIRKGGMGTVFVCLDLKTNQPLALKTFHYECFTDKAATERFLQGAETWIRLGKHENVARAFFVNEISGRPFLFLEYIPGDREYGPDLSGWIWGKGLDLTTTLSFAIQFCQGMEYAAKKSAETGKTFVHRDIKPSNILVTHDKVVKVTDFDLVKTFFQTNKNIHASVLKDEKTGAERYGFTVAGAACGTPPYMSPEQWKNGEDVDLRSDIYSFGCVLYEMLAGHPPFQCTSFESYRASHSQIIPKSPRDSSPGVPQELSALVMKCLAKSPAERFKDFVLLRQALTEIQRNLMVPGNRALEEDNLSELSNRGFSLAQLGKHEEALACFDRILAKNPNHLMAWGNKGMVFHMQGRRDEALACIDKVLEINPGDATGWNNKGLILGASRLEEAKRCVEKALEIDPRMARAWFNKGDFLWLEKKHDEAISCYNKALSIDPRYLDAWYRQGTLYGELKEYGKAVECYERALEINPASMEVLNDKAAILILQGRVKEAMQALDRVIESNPNLVLAWFNKASILERQGKEEEAAACLDRMLESNPKDASAWAYRGDFENRLRHWDMAIRFYNRALELNPQNTLAWKGKGHAHSMFGQSEAAIESFEHALKDDPDDPMLWYEKGRNLELTGKIDEGLSCYEQAVKIDPHFTPALLSKGSALDKLGRPKEALSAYKLYLRHAENEPPEIVKEMRLIVKQMESEGKGFTRRLFS